MSVVFRGAVVLSGSGTGVPPVDSGVSGSGMGVPPVDSGVSGSGMGVPPMNSGVQSPPCMIIKRQGAYLPHWSRGGDTYSVTFRLGDSLPRQVLDSWLAEMNHIIQSAAQLGRPLGENEERRLQYLHSRRVETSLDMGDGACWLRQPAIAQIVADALRFFDGRRYLLHAWCVMPNHVHVIVEPLSPHGLPDVLHSWKSFTAKMANRRLGRVGEFWQEEYYDHLLRDERDYVHALSYLEENPVKAGLTSWPWIWRKAYVP